LLELKSRGDFIVMCIARLAPPKRFDLFCAAAAICWGRSTWVWIGNRAPQQGLPSNVICLGEHPRASRLLPYADVFVLPSDYEGLPVSILEACARGKPVVASAVGGISEIVTPLNGFCVRNLAEAFADRIDELRQDAALRGALGIEARRTYESEFTLDRMVRSYEELYDLAGSPR
jgi:glycosyltransferase involved in cell wall biosynthesis